jgi:ketosteroid isomerase-like protein
MTLDETDHGFFAALRSADGPALETLLAPDFVLIDVLRGTEVQRHELIAALGAGLLRFEVITPLGSRTRRYGSTAVVTGETSMSGHFGPSPWSAHSRYTHVYVEQDGRWRLASAQGTPILDG